MAGHRLHVKAYRPPVPLYASIAVFLLFGFFLVAQPGRWANTPSYGILLNIADQTTWGSLYLVIGTCLTATAYFRIRPFTVITFTAAFALLGTWLLAFIVRFATDDGTTIANIIAWSVYLTLLIEAALALDEDGE